VFSSNSSTAGIPAPLFSSRLVDLSRLRYAGIPAFHQSVQRNKDMATGTVKWFNDAKGFGFITPEGGGEDLFAHFSEIQAAGFKSLKENQRVEFEVKMGPKGKQATAIKPI